MEGTKTCPKIGDVRIIQERVRAKGAARAVCTRRFHDITQIIRGDEVRPIVGVGGDEVTKTHRGEMN